MRRSPLEEGYRWLMQSQQDLYWAKHLALQGGFHLACFLSQQVAEKALKAFLYAQGDEIVIGHSVERLIRDAAELDRRFTKKGKTWSYLDGFYIPTRYPNGLPDGIPADVYTADAAQQATSLAEEVVDFVEELLTQMKGEKR